MPERVYSPISKLELYSDKVVDYLSTESPGLDPIFEVPAGFNRGLLK